MVDELKAKYEEKPDSSFFRNMLIRAYIEAKQADKAEKMIDEAISSGCEEWFLYQTKGDLLYSRNLLEEALSCYEKAWSIDSETYCDTLCSFLCIYKQMGDKEKAIEICKEWIKWYEDRGAIIEKRHVERELESLQK